MSARINAMCIVNVAKAENIATPQIETGNGFTVILKADGTVWMTGNEEIVATGTGGTTKNTDITDNNNTDDVGAIINRPQTNGARPQQIKINETEYLTNVIKISSGNNHVLALTKNGEVYAWGKNNNGQLGTCNVPLQTTYATPVSGEGGSSILKRIIDISAGETGSTAINESGWVYVWGNGTNGEYGNGGTTSSNTPVKTVVNQGISASIGEGHIVALGQNGKLYTWGKNNAGQLGTGNTTNNTIVGKIADRITDITAGGNFSIVKDTEGNIYGTGQNTNGELGIEGNTNITTLTKIEMPENMLVGAGPVSAHKVKYIKSGKTNTTIMLSDGTVWSTGIGTNGELGNGTNENTSIFVQGLTLVENGNEENRADTGPAPTEGDNAEDSNVDALTSHISPLTSHASPLTSVLTIGRNTGLNTAVILENGYIYITGNNTYKQITNEQEEGTNYYVPMRYIDIEAPEEIELQVGGNRTLTEDELIYQKDTINVYKQDLITIPLIDYIQTEDEKIATYEQGKIEALEVGTTKLKVEEGIHDILFYIPVKVYGKIIGNITTENHEGKHIAEVTLYKTGDIRKEEDVEETSGGTQEESSDTTIPTRK